MKIESVDFPEALLNALRDKRLVVFAGAGVSMAKPAELPSFRKLAEQVAEGTGKSIAASETDDQFLGRLEKDPGVKVHQRAARILQRDNLQPNGLHRSLLRLFQKTGDPVRIVTTNFDCLFEQAAETGDLFKNKPKVFEAPALPLGSCFEGIVHLHGSVKEPKAMVLTHRDFGRAYLTEEDGWARRFLVSLFANHTVLFVGYSHSDTIMTYLTPSLPPDGGEKRFALVGSASNDLDRWRRMGIKPIGFPQENRDDFTCLDEGVKGLADFRRRRLQEWRKEITRIAAQEPLNINDEDRDTINYALGSLDLTRFFVQAAESPKWIAWLDDLGHLKRLFAEGDLEEQDKILSEWLACRFVRKHSDELFSVICCHHGKLNWYLWTRFVSQLYYIEDSPLDSHTLSQWIHILMNCIPMSGYEDYLWILAEHCIKADALQSFLQVYDAITARLVWFLPGSEHRDSSWNDYIKQLWQESLQLNLPKIAHTLLNQVTMRLEQRHSARVVWYQDDDRMDGDSLCRSAIEPHDQNQYPHRIGPLIDVARDCLEWLATNDFATARAWCDRFAGANAPLLRRLAVHTVRIRQDLSANEKISWLLEKFDIYETATRHEIFCMVADAYPQASSQQRQELIQTISQYQAPAEPSYDNVVRSAYYQFNWFQWLHRSDPNCSLLKPELNRIQSQYPQFQPTEHPDFNCWDSGVSLSQSPWSCEELLTKPAPEWLPDLLDYQPNPIEEDRMNMLMTICNAAERDPSWGLDLADTMAAQSEWESDLWAWVIYAWKREETNLDQDSTRRVLSHLSTRELHRQSNARAIADVLNRLIQKTDVADLQQWLDTLHTIAINIHPYAVAVEDEPTEGPQDRDWFEVASNHHPSGKLAEFWLHSISHWYRQQAEPPQVLSPEHRRALDAIIEDNGIPGKLGRTILASQLHFLHRVDSAWAEQRLLPLFDAEHEDFPCAWDGYLIYGISSLQMAELLRDKLIGGLQRVIRDFSQRRLSAFICCYIGVLSRLIKDAQDTWISEFFKYANDNDEVRHKFAIQIDNYLRNLSENEQQEWWDVWLKDYWNNRLDGVPYPLDDTETATMLQWAIHLQGVFPEAVSMAVRMNPVNLKECSCLLRQIDQSNLIDCHPNDLARFLIYFGQSDHLPSSWKCDLNVLDKLLRKDLPGELVQDLHELIVRIEVA